MNSLKSYTIELVLLLCIIQQTTAFSPSHLSTRKHTPLSMSFNEEEQPKKKGFFQNFFEELDAFVDDATSRRLGNGAQYYGKRKSSFYGEDDANRKRDKVS